MNASSGFVDHFNRWTGEGVGVLWNGNYCKEGNAVGWKGTKSRKGTKQRREGKNRRKKFLWPYISLYSSAEFTSEIEQMISNGNSYICTYCTQATISLRCLYKYQIDSSEIFSRNRGFQTNPHLYPFSQDTAKIECRSLLKMNYIFPAPVQ